MAAPNSSSNDSLPLGPAPPIPPYWKQGLDYLENMGNFSSIIEQKSKAVESDKKYLSDTIQKIQTAIDEIKTGIEKKEETCDTLEGEFDKAIGEAIGKQKTQLEELYSQIKNISDFSKLQESLGQLKGNVNLLGSKIQPNAVSVNDTDGEFNGKSFEDQLQLENAPIKGGYTYGKLKRRSRRKRKGKKSPKRKGKKSKKRN